MFSQDWNTIYKKNKQVNNWPWSELVSYFNRYSKKKIKKNFNVLEIGSGTGPNAIFFFNNNIKYKAIEGSSKAVKIQKKKYPKYKKNFVCADFTKSLKFKEKFNLIFDRGSITHNGSEAVQDTVKLIKKSLKKNGYFFGLDWFSTSHSDYKKGKITTDKRTKIYSSGNLSGVGNVHFFDKNEIKKIFKSFQIIELVEKKYSYHKKNKKKIISFWIIIVKKK